MVAPGCAWVRTTPASRSTGWHPALEVLDILVQRRRDNVAAMKFFRKLLRGLLDAPRVIISDTLKSYDAAKREILPVVEHLCSAIIASQHHTRVGAETTRTELGAE